MLRMIGIFPHPPIVLPEVGRNEWIKVKKTYEAMESLAKDFLSEGIKKLIIISPHGPGFRDSLLISNEEELTGDLGNFNFEKKYLFKNDLDMATAIYEHPENKNNLFVLTNPSGSGSFSVRPSLDHGVLVPMYFLEKELGQPEVVNISPGFMTDQALLKAGQIIADVIDQQKEPTAVVISADLSHRLDQSGYYGFAEAGPVFDAAVCDALAKNKVEDVLRIDPEITEEAGQCGYIPLVLSAGMLRNKKYTSELLHYEHPFGVGYMVSKIMIRGE